MVLVSYASHLFDLGSKRMSRPLMPICEIEPQYPIP
jgi:hypothetical protein